MRVNSEVLFEGLKEKKDKERNQEVDVRAGVFL